MKNGPRQHEKLGARLHEHLVLQHVCDLLDIDETLAFLPILVHEDLDLLHEHISNLQCEDETFEHGRPGNATVKRKNMDEKEGKQFVI